MQGAGCGVQGAGCMVQGEGCRGSTRLRTPRALRPARLALLSPLLTVGPAVARSLRSAGCRRFLLRSAQSARRGRLLLKLPLTVPYRFPLTAPHLTVPPHRRRPPIGLRIRLRAPCVYHRRLEIQAEEVPVQDLLICRGLPRRLRRQPCEEPQIRLVFKARRLFCITQLQAESNKEEEEEDSGLEFERFLGWHTLCEGELNIGHGGMLS